MYFANGDIYEGEWLEDKRHGKGMLRLANNNRYEGEWKLDKKNGNGKFFFLNKGQMLDGYWVNDINKTGEMIDFDRENAKEATKYELPAVSNFKMYYSSKMYNCLKEQSCCLFLDSC